MLRKNRELKLIFLVLAVLFAAFLAVPAVRLLLKSFLGDEGFTGTFYISVFTARNFTKTLGNSFLVSIVSALLAVGVAFVFAYAIHYTKLPRGIKRGLQAVATLPMFLPTITYGFAIIYSFGKQGLITRLFGHQLFNIYGFGGLLVGYVIYTVPVAFLLIHNTMGYVDKKTLVVSKAMGDKCFATFWIAVLRPLLGTLAGAFIQAFFLCFTDFGIPASVGGKFDVIATVLYNEMLGGVPDFNRGAVVAVVMLLPSVLSILLLRWLEKYNIRYDRISQADLATNPGRDTAWGGIRRGAVGRHPVDVCGAVRGAAGAELAVSDAVHPGAFPGRLCRQRIADGLCPLVGHGPAHSGAGDAGSLWRGPHHGPEHLAQMVQAAH